MVKFFRIIAFLEGVSYLFLFLVSMPLKYSGVSEVPNQIGGMVHGGLFVLYILMIIPVGLKVKWNFKTMLIVGVLSVLPFGTFYMDKKYFKK